MPGNGANPSTAIAAPLAAPLVLGQTTVTGLISDPGGNPATGGTVTFVLSPPSSAIAFHVAGTSIVAPRSVVCQISPTGQLLNEAGTGPCLIWGNPAILPANTTYTLFIAPNVNGSPVTTSTIYGVLIFGTTYDLSNIQFAPNVEITPQQSVLRADPVEANLIPITGHVFNLGSQQLPYAALYVDNIHSANITNSGDITTNTIHATTYFGLPTATSTLGIFNVKDFGAVGNGVANDTVAIQNTINAAGTQSVIWFPPGTYLVTSQLSVVNHRVYLNGAGQQASVILFAPTANGTCLKIALSPVTGDIVQGGISGLTFFSSDSTFHKTAINIVSVSSYFVRDVFIWGSAGAGGIYWSDTTFGSIGLLTNGHELTTVNNFYTFADQPLVIGPDPVSALSCDQFNFTDCTFAANNNPCVFVQDNVGLTNVNFLGRQSWSGGTYGFLWVNSIGSSSYYALRFDNVRWEQVQGTAGWAFYISFTGQTVAISAIARASSVVTVTVPVGSPFVVGKRVVIAGVTPVSFNGNFAITSYSSATGTLTYTQGGANVSGSGGTAAPSGGANVREITMINHQLQPGANGFYFNLAVAVLMMNVQYLGTGVALNVDTTSSGFVFWNVTLGLTGATVSLGTPPFTDFFMYNSIAGPSGGRLSMGTFDLTSLINIPYQTAIAALNSTGVSKRLIGLGAILANTVGIDQDALGVVMGGLLRIGGYIGGSSIQTGLMMPNTWSLLGANTTASGTIPICQVDATNGVALAPGGHQINVDGPLVMQGKRFNVSQGATVASNSTITLGTDGNVFQISGTANISLIDVTNWQQGSMITLIFLGALNLGHLAGGAGQMNLRADVNLAVTVNTTHSFVLSGTTWYQVD